ncbi:MAG: hypothetical protein JO165_07885, partial [Candidatus Eremiobacteraeota bacterium]|nr:hypothetical protein [Candidatus Eremiobacteraeota bacterium]
VEISYDNVLPAAGFDIVHLTNLTSPDATLLQAQSVREFPGPVVLMPIFIDHADETVWGMKAELAVYSHAADEGDLQEKLGLIETRRLSIEEVQPPPARMELGANYTSMQRAILSHVDYAIANAHSEMHRLYRYLDYGIPYSIAPSCADPSVYGPHTKDAFVEAYGLNDFVLLAGRFEARKNQLFTFEAYRRLGFPLLCIGGNNDVHFGMLMRAYRPPGVQYIAHLPESELAGAFAAARVVAIPSWDEVVSLTSLNAAISEASLVLTRNSYEHEYFGDDAYYCDPGSILSIASAIEHAWSTHTARAQRRTELASRVRREYNWDRSAELTERAYYRVLANNPRGAARRRQT